MTLQDRLENWARCWRRRIERKSVHSIEGTWRSPQPWHELGAPSYSPAIDPLDALEVEHAVCTVDMFHHVLVKGWYVLQWPEPRCLSAARKATGETNTRRRGDFVASLAMAHALIATALTLPACIRRDRARALAADALHIPLALDECH